MFPVAFYSWAKTKMPQEIAKDLGFYSFLWHSLLWGIGTKYDMPQESTWIIGIWAFLWHFQLEQNFFATRNRSKPCLLMNLVANRDCWKMWIRKPRIKEQEMNKRWTRDDRKIKAKKVLAHHRMRQSFRIVFVVQPAAEPLGFTLFGSQPAAAPPGHVYPACGQPYAWRPRSPVMLYLLRYLLWQPRGSLG